MKFFTALIILYVVLFAGSGLTVQKDHFFSQSGTNEVIPAIGEIPVRTELEQGWDQETRLNFWFTSQGSQLIPYKWFTWLEQKDNTSLFRSTEHMEMHRYLPIESSEQNPSGLPIGFSITEPKKGKDQWLGMTCAACHSNQINFGTHKLLIEGGPTLANFVGFMDDLKGAMNQTGMDEEKFGRFARNVLAEEFSDKNAAKLKAQLLTITTDVANRILVNALPEEYPSDFTSYGRLDAFGNIQNAGSAFALDDLSNRNPPTAPVSYPFLWGTHQSDVVQWNASAPNTPVIGPLVRNMGEAVGVFGKLKIERTSWFRRLFGKDRKYDSSVNFHGLGKLESWVKSLQSPQWPEAILPAIDTSKANRGRQLFDEHCVSCHQVIPRNEEGLKYKAVRTPLIDVGTDPMMAWNAQYHQAKTLLLEGSRTEILLGQKFKDSTRALDISVDGVLGMIKEHPIKALEAGLITEFAKGPKKIKEYVKDHAAESVQLQPSGPDASPGHSANGDLDLTGLVYKSRPLNGIWATAPYLHNGSVPNLWELLAPSSERVTSFWVGDRTFDPVNVGFRTDSGLSQFNVLDQQGEIIPGNDNAGHEYGSDLTEIQKWDLVEYMKTL